MPVYYYALRVADEKLGCLGFNKKKLFEKKIRLIRDLHPRPYEQQPIDL